MVDVIKSCVHFRYSEQGMRLYIFVLFLQIVNFTKPALIAPQKTLTPFFVQFQANGSDVAFSTILRVYTNASIFTVPIYCYDGKVKVGNFIIENY